MLRKFHDAGLLGISLLALTALAVLLGLGAWQWSRKAWKEDLIATIAARSKAAPIDAAAWAGRNCEPADKVGLARSCEYVAVRLAGTFDHTRERHVYTNIARPADGGFGGQGYWVVTPFRLAGSDLTIAVSRGFVPEAAKSPQHRPEGQIAGETSLVGLLRGVEVRATFTAVDNPAQNMWFLRNPRDLFGGAGGPLQAYPDFYVEVLSPAPPGGVPQPTAGRIDIPNRHLGYALTWWGLAVTLLAVYAAFVRERLKATAASVMISKSASILQPDRGRTSKSESH